MTPPMRSPAFLALVSFAIPALLAACSSSTALTSADVDAGASDAAPSLRDSASPVDAAPEGATGPDIELTAADFTCILQYPKVRRFRITNKLGNVDATLAVAAADGGTPYPVGTLIQLIPNEAMVKRRAGFSPATRDWEFFSLSTSDASTTILDRGGDKVKNAFGGSCANCHGQAQPQWDFVCETTHGCEPLPFNEAQILAVQNADPRCP